MYSRVIPNNVIYNMKDSWQQHQISCASQFLIQYKILNIRLSRIIDLKKGNNMASSVVLGKWVALVSIITMLTDQTLYLILSILSISIVKNRIIGLASRSVCWQIIQKNRVFAHYSQKPSWTTGSSRMPMNSLKRKVLI